MIGNHGRINQLCLLIEWLGNVKPVRLLCALPAHTRPSSLGLTFPRKPQPIAPAQQHLIAVRNGRESAVCTANFTSIGHALCSLAHWFFL